MIWGRDIEAGSEVGGYRVESVLGRGGMGVVYLATHLQLGRAVALKVLPPELSDDEEFRSRFIRESQLAASLDHPNVVPIYDAGEDQGVIYLASRYVDGGDLRARLIERGSLSAELAVAIVAHVALALDAAHSAGLVHRDVKPANILLGRDDRPYLCDFGLARSSSSTRLTRTGTFLGSVDYCSPEQIDGQPVDGRADIYALGCVLYHCLAGQPPYVRESDVGVIKAHLLDPTPLLVDARPDLRALSDVLAVAMAKAPGERYGTAGEFGASLAAQLPGLQPRSGLPFGAGPAAADDGGGTVVDRRPAREGPARSGEAVAPTGPTAAESAGTRTHGDTRADARPGARPGNVREPTAPRARHRKRELMAIAASGLAAFAIAAFVGFELMGSRSDSAHTARPGSVDTTFGVGGKATAAVPGAFVAAVALQSDGRLVALGAGGNPAANDYATLARFNADGSLDRSFGVAGEATLTTPGGSSGHALLVLPNGKLVIAGISWNLKYFGAVTVARYDSDGSLDSGFGANGVATTRIAGRDNRGEAAVLQPDGKLVVGGDLVSSQNCDVTALFRFDADGSQDPGFGVRGIAQTGDAPAAGCQSGPSPLLYALVRQPDGKFVVCDAVGGNVTLVRIDTDGTVDTTFATKGVLRTAIPIFNFNGGCRLALQPDGKILAATTSSPGTFTLSRYDANGTVDPSFGSDGKVVSELTRTANLRALLVLPDGKLIVAGGPFVLARFDSDGSLDTSFGAKGRARATLHVPSEADALALQPDGKIVVAGTTGAGKGSPAGFTLVRFNQ